MFVIDHDLLAAGALRLHSMEIEVEGLQAQIFDDFGAWRIQHALKPSTATAAYVKNQPGQFFQLCASFPARHRRTRAPALIGSPPELALIRSTVHQEWKVDTVKVK